MGMDLFQYYIDGVRELLSKNDSSPSPVTTSRLAGVGNGSFRMKEVGKEGNGYNEKRRPGGFDTLFCNAVGDGLSVHEKERLTAMLRRSVIALNQEVDEMLDPVFSMLQLRGLMEPTKCSAICQDANDKVETEERSRKRLKIHSSLSQVNKPVNVSPVSYNLTEEGSISGQKGVAEPGKSLTRCNNTECVKYAQERNCDENKSSRGDCSKQGMNESFLGSSSRDDKENGEVNDDLQILLVNRGPKVLEKLEKHSAEFSATLGRMEEKLEELLDIVISNCRPMTLAEKQELRRLIQNLPPQNLDRVVEIIQRGKPPEKQSRDDDVTVDLLNEDNVTLWRIYFHVKAVENAIKLL